MCLGSFLTHTQKGVISALLCRMYKYNFVSECFEFNAILDDMDEKCFKAFSPANCLHQVLVLLPVKSYSHGLHPRDHNLLLSNAITTLDVIFCRHM